jgi:diguanylate cyclase (GGDEF)-like protein
LLQLLLPEKVSSEVRREQIRLLYHQGTTIQLLGLFTAIVAVLMFWNVSDRTNLLVWFGVMALLTGIRLGVNARFDFTLSDSEIIEKWGLIYVAGTFLSGVVWGSLSLFFDPAWPAPYQIVIFAIYTGLIAGAFNSNSSFFIAFPAFYFPLVLFLMGMILQQKDEGYYPLLALFVIYILQMYISSIKFNKRLANALHIRFENEQLADKLVKANAKLVDLADKDELTQLHNRRSLVRYLGSEWNRHYLSQSPISLLFIDIDYFKQYNDTYGHERGDQCLARIASILQSNAKRSGDMAARYGGEEFAVVLPQTETLQALKIAENIHADLNGVSMIHQGSKVTDTVTMSIGVTTIVPQEPDRYEELFRSADKALYQAKEGGRNCTVQAVL